MVKINGRKIIIKKKYKILNPNHKLDKLRESLIQGEVTQQSQLNLAILKQSLKISRKAPMSNILAISLQ